MSNCFPLRIWGIYQSIYYTVYTKTSIYHITLASCVNKMKKKIFQSGSEHVLFHIPHLFFATPKRLLSKKGNRIPRQSLTHTHAHRRTICIVILMVSAFMALPALRLLRRIMMERESEIRKINRKLIGLHCDCPFAVAFIALYPLPP